MKKCRRVDDVDFTDEGIQPVVFRLKSQLLSMLGRLCHLHLGITRDLGVRSPGGGPFRRVDDRYVVDGEEIQGGMAEAAAYV